MRRNELSCLECKSGESSSRRRVIFVALQHELSNKNNKILNEGRYKTL